jgi:hypothetical protein
LKAIALPVFCLPLTARACFSLIGVGLEWKRLGLAAQACRAEQRPAGAATSPAAGAAAAAAAAAASSCGSGRRRLRRSRQDGAMAKACRTRRPKLLVSSLPPPPTRPLDRLSPFSPASLCESGQVLSCVGRAEGGSDSKERHGARLESRLLPLELLPHMTWCHTGGTV